MTHTPAEIHNIRRGYDSEWLPDGSGRITRPGKFEGEQIYVPHFWDVTLDGCCDQRRDGAWIVEITDEDRRLFPELGKKRRRVALFEDSQGFVTEV